MTKPAAAEEEGTLVGVVLGVVLVTTGVGIHVVSWLTVGAGPIWDDTLRFLFSGTPAALSVILLLGGGWLSWLHVRYAVNWELGAVGAGMVALWLLLVAVAAGQVGALAAVCVVGLVVAFDPGRRAGRQAVPAKDEG